MPYPFPLFPTAALEGALTVKGTFPQLSRSMALVSTAIAIALGATAMAGIAVLGPTGSATGSGTCPPATPGIPSNTAGKLTVRMP